MFYRLTSLNFIVKFSAIFACWIDTTCGSGPRKFSVMRIWIHFTDYCNIVLRCNWAHSLSLTWSSVEKIPIYLGNRFTLVNI